MAAAALFAKFFLQQFQYFIRRHLAADVAATEQAVGEVAFVLMQLDNFFFYGVSGNQSVYGHGALLAHAMSAVGRLIFDGGIPPRIHVYHVVRGGKVEPCAAGF